MNKVYSKNNLQYYRTGRIPGGKCGPQKLRLDSWDDVKMLTNQRVFCADNMRCYSDETIMQQQIIHNALKALDERKKSDEDNLVLRYVRNIPTIMLRSEPSGNKNATVEKEINIGPASITIDLISVRVNPVENNISATIMLIHGEVISSTVRIEPTMVKHIRMPFEYSMKYPQPQMGDSTENNNYS
ncbi:hypothetical protein QAD02_017169 [Eretmocerus hayati]|uniref:Uncharacterized protein n=1 Tax=Eretmocerus hayati TaxID=131215 RepID=A0ACC2PDI5_9HYME|nr:hypothetical protein QAD02_017169 [Eretmocerus hayati]